jgi:tetratricopeptide (TPR) repeat protein
MMLMEVLGGGDAFKGARFGEQALDIARQYNMKEEQAFILNDLARAYFQIGRTDQGWLVHDEAQGLWKELGNRAMLADSLGSESEGRYAYGEFDKALLAGLEGLKVAQSIDNPWSKAYNLMGLCFVYVEIGEIAKGLQVSREAGLLGQEAGFPAAEFLGRYMIILINTFLGDPARGLQLYQEAIEKGPVGFPSWEALSEVGLAYYHLLNGDLDKANQFFNSAIMEIDLNSLDIIFSPILGIFICEVLLANNDPAKALAYVEKVIAHRVPRHLLSFLPDLYLLKGKALIKMGQNSEGIETLEAAYHVAEESGSKRALWSLLPVLMDAYQANGDAERAEAARQKAKTLAKFLLDQIEEDNLRGKFLEKFGYLIN